MNYFDILTLFFLTNITIWSYTILPNVNFQYIIYHKNHKKHKEYIHLNCCNKQDYNEQNNKQNNKQNCNKKLNYKNNKKNKKNKNNDAAMIPLNTIPKNKKWLEEIPNKYNNLNIKDTQYLSQYILRKNITFNNFN